MTEINCSMMSDSEADFIQEEDEGNDSDFECENIAPVSSKRKPITSLTKKVLKTVSKKATKASQNLLTITVM